MTPPNLFDYATKELSQDAVICWLLAWAGAKGRSKAEEELRRRGRALVEALLGKWCDGGAFPLGDQVRTEILHQERNIDVLARVNGRHVLLIEDKTNTRAHDDQLARYLRLVAEHYIPVLLQQAFRIGPKSRGRFGDSPGGMRRSGGRSSRPGWDGTSILNRPRAGNRRWTMQSPTSN